MYWIVFLSKHVIQIYRCQSLRDINILYHYCMFEKNYNHTMYFFTGYFRVYEFEAEKLAVLSAKSHLS